MKIFQLGAVIFQNYTCKTKLRVFGGHLSDDGLSSPNTLWF